MEPVGCVSFDLNSREFESPKDPQLAVIANKNKTQSLDGALLIRLKSFKIEGYSIKKNLKCQEEVAPVGLRANRQGVVFTYKWSGFAE